jgi:hypothetical protein
VNLLRKIKNSSLEGEPKEVDAEGVNSTFSGVLDIPSIHWTFYASNIT